MPANIYTYDFENFEPYQGENDICPDCGGRFTAHYDINSDQHSISYTLICDECGTTEASL